MVLSSPAEVGWAGEGWNRKAMSEVLPLPPWMSAVLKAAQRKSDKQSVCSGVCTGDEKRQGNMKNKETTLRRPF